MKSRTNIGRIGGRIGVRIMRPWRGYPVGAVINPPGAMRQILLQAKDQLGNKVAEIVEEPVPDTVPVFVADAEEEAAEDDSDDAVPEIGGDGEVKRKRGRQRKGETK
jgi:hypothetical protein